MRHNFSQKIVGFLITLILGGALAFAWFQANKTFPPPSPTKQERDNRSSTTRSSTVWQLHTFDVGTGLSILLTGPDFTLLYDGGSNDDRATGNNNRLLAYLQDAIGPSQGEGCSYHPEAINTSERFITHLFLSHPHRDHVVLLPDVIRCYAIRHIWDSGAYTSSTVYQEFLRAVSQERGVTYHSAKSHPTASRQGKARRSRPSVPFRNGERIPLGRSARATILNARSDARDLNDNSIVLRINLGPTAVLLTGDATAGPRASPSVPPSAGSVEHHLLAHHRELLDADILQVGHHGSKTSSRKQFLDAVSPKWAIVSAGPTQYGNVVLPDHEVIEELERRNVRVLRTDVDDDRCRTQKQKVGLLADGKPGGCNGYVLRIFESGQIVLE